MKKRRIVIALGHDALGTTLPEQKKAAKEAAKAIVDFIQDDCQVVITHSNGPQVGMIHTAMAEFHRVYPEYTATPMSVCSAMSQGYIGYDLQNSIRTELLNRGIYKPVSTVLTQVTVDPYDDAFYAPTNIIGRVMDEKEAEAEEKKGNHVVKVENGYRRIVAAPKPMEIIELDAVNALLDADQIVIAAGGGGIPVLVQGNVLKGASAVIEKDLIAGALAKGVNAQQLVILTGVENVNLSQLVYVESKARKLCYVFADKVLELYDNITTAQKQLEPYGFVRIHQSFLVNMKYIQKISSYRVYLTTHKDLPATKARYQEVKDQFFEYIEYDSEG